VLQVALSGDLLDGLPFFAKFPHASRSAAQVAPIVASVLIFVAPGQEAKSDTG
jgi:hypothetical protein